VIPQIKVWYLLLRCGTSSYGVAFQVKGDSSS
jgi:hypothetical protein